MKEQEKEKQKPAMQRKVIESERSILVRLSPPDNLLQRVPAPFHASHEWNNVPRKRASDRHLLVKQTG